MKVQAPSVSIVPVPPGKQDQGRDTGMGGHLGMSRPSAYRVLATLALAGLLGACGQKGPLVLPAPLPPPPSAAASAPAPITAAPPAATRPAPPRSP